MTRLGAGKRVRGYDGLRLVAVLMAACSGPEDSGASEAPEAHAATATSSGRSATTASRALGAEVVARAAASITVTDGPTSGAELNVYFGNLHSHTSYSDGSGTPEDAFTVARAAGLHFLAVTEHNHRLAESGAGADRRDGLLIATDHELYAGTAHSLIETARRMSVAGEFAAIYGQEWSSISSGNHVNVFAVDDVIDDAAVTNGDFEEMIQWIEQRESGTPTLLQFNHPGEFDESWREYGRDDFGSVESWLATMDRHAELIEILNGPAMAHEGGHEPADTMEADYREYLNLGFHLAPTADQDNHYRTWGLTTEARTGVLAAELTPEAVLGGLRARRVFATEDADLAAVLWVAGVLMGAEVPCGAEAVVPVELRVLDGDEPDASYEASIFADTAPGAAEAVMVEEVDVSSGAAQLVASVTRPAAGGYVFARITQNGEHGNDRVWTAPVWFAACGDAPPTPAPSAAGIVIDAVLPDPEGLDEEDERVRLRNAGAERVDVRGWRIRDRSGNTWSLEGRIAAGATLEVVRSGQAMALNNTGGELVELLDAEGAVVDSFDYERAETGAWVTR